MANNENEMEITTNNYRNYNGYGYDYDGSRINRYEMRLNHEIEERDCALALEKAKGNTREEIIETYKQLKSEMNDLERHIDHRLDKLEEFEKAQAVYNATNTSTVSWIKREVDALLGLTELKIPAKNVVGDVTTNS